MTPDRWSRIKDAFADLLDLPPEERPAALDALDADLRDEVAALLAAESDAGSRPDDPLAPPPALFDVAAAAAALPPDLVGQTVGPYRITGHVGRGGMGEVYRAERADGLHDRPVALKVVRADSAAVLSRFDAERRILGRLSHPGIARLLEAGLVAEARPWIAMDYVDGEPITAFADARGLDTAGRVRLLAATARTVHAAHQNLVVHRDLKPSNVLVRTGADGTPEPVLLDFGIAKLLSEDDDLTATGERPMTRAYAAPEQLRGEPATTATDVYALGLLLYELLAGQRPFADASSPLAYEQAVLDTDPAPPSRVAEASTGTGRGLRGDLDTICLTALRKNPQERYASAEALAADLQRYLDGLPIAARPPTVGYRVRKFVRRHRVGVAVTAAVVALLVAGGVLHTARVTAERDAAAVAQARAEAVSEFLVGLFEASDPTGDGRPDASLREVLDAGAERLASDLTRQPDVRSDLMRVVGTVYASLGLFEPAQAQLDDAISIARRAGATDVLAEALLQRGNLDYRIGRFAPARAALTESLALTERLAGRDAERTATVLNSLALTDEALGDTTAALRAYERIVAIRRAATGGHPDRNFAANLSNLADLVRNRGDLVRAESLYAEAHRNLTGDVGRNHPYVAFLLNSRAGLYEDQGDVAAARADLAEALRIGLDAFGESHPFTAVVLHNTGTMEAAAGRTAAAVAALERARTIRRQIGDPDLAETEAELAALGR